MARPPLGVERRTQILDAFARCLARDGLARTTLDDVAREAGLKRALLRHFVGNRDALIRQGAEHLSQRYRAGVAARLERIRREERIDAILDHLFLTGFVTDHAAEDRAIDALFAAAASDEVARVALRRLFEGYEESLAEELAAAFPGASPARVAAVAYALVCMSEQHAALLALGFPKARKRALRRLAAGLVAGLADGSPHRG